MAKTPNVDTFVRDVSDSAIVGIQRAFERAGLTVAGKPLGAVGPSGSSSLSILKPPDVVWILDRSRTPSERARMNGESEHWLSLLHAYAWFARQFVRGATGRDFGLSSWSGPEDDPLWKPIGLGHDIWRLGRNVANVVLDKWVEWAEGQDPATSRRIAERALRGDRSGVVNAIVYEDIVGRYLRPILESVRTRLNWPRLPDDYDPPRPSEWPLEEVPEVKWRSPSGTYALRKAKLDRMELEVWLRSALNDGERWDWKVSQHTPEAQMPNRWTTIANGQATSEREAKQLAVTAAVRASQGLGEVRAPRGLALAAGLFVGGALLVKRRTG